MEPAGVRRVISRWPWSAGWLRMSSPAGKGWMRGSDLSGASLPERRNREIGIVEPGSTSKKDNAAYLDLSVLFAYS
jgi:hypothetical protein